MKGSINLDEATAVAQTGANNDKIHIHLLGGTVIKVRLLPARAHRASLRLTLIPQQLQAGSSALASEWVAALHACAGGNLGEPCAGIIGRLAQHLAATEPADEVASLIVYLEHMRKEQGGGAAKTQVRDNRRRSRRLTLSLPRHTQQH